MSSSEARRDQPVHFPYTYTMSHKVPALQVWDRTVSRTVYAFNKMQLAVHKTRQG